MKISQCVPTEILGQIAEAVFTTNFDSVMVTKSTGKTPIIYVNRVFTELTGYDAEDVIGKSPSLLQGPETDSGVLDQLRADLESGRNFEGRATNYRKDGTPFTMHWRVAPVKSEDGEVHYYIAVQREG
ncbi:MAG: PAS domain S-box-containing protein [Pirellulaceae bacterium]|jgi:PAS domain S-box-containing protein